MSNWSIQIENVSKLYPIGGGAALGNSLRDDLTRWVRGAARRVARPVAPANAAADAKTPAGQFWALRDVSFEVPRGQALGIIGRNGAGKSTLLKVLSRITAPTAGEVRYRGRLASLLEVGTGFHRELTGRENIFLNGTILGMRRAEVAARLDEIVAFAEVDQFLDSPVKFYSSGMYVRLAFAVAAHLRTDILIVDEVLAVGDASFQKKCLGKMEAASTEQGRTVLFVSHNIPAIRRLCHGAVLMEKGRATPFADVEEAIARYCAEAVASETDVDLSTMPRPAHDGLGETARLLRVRVAPGSTLAFAEPLRLRVEFECHRPIEDSYLGVSFDSPEGFRVMSLDSDQSHPPFSLPAGRHEIELSLPFNPLHPGTYLCNLALASGRRGWDVLMQAFTWEVRSPESDELSDRSFGGCRLPMEVRLDPDGAADELRRDRSTVSVPV